MRMNVSLMPKEQWHRHMNTLKISKCVVGMGGRAGQGRVSKKAKTLRGGLSFSILWGSLVYCLRATGDEWKIRQDDVESEGASR